MKILTRLLPFLLFSTNTWAAVNPYTGGYSGSWLDLQAPTPDLPSLTRTYNSEARHTGLFGFAMCSNWETSLKVIDDLRVEIRHCGAGKTTRYYRTNKKTKVFTNPQADAGSVSVSNNHYRLQLPEHQWQTFNQRGQLVKSGFQDTVSYLYSGDKLSKITSKSGVTYNLTYNKSGLVTTVTTSTNLKLHYHYNSSQFLTKVINGWQNASEFKYQDGRHLSQIVYSDLRWEGIHYNSDQRVATVLDRNGCRENFAYQNLKNALKISQHKVCGKETISKGSYTVHFSNSKKWGRQIAQVVTETEKGEVSTATFDRQTGLLKSQQSPGRALAIEQKNSKALTSQTTNTRTGTKIVKRVSRAGNQLKVDSIVYNRGKDIVAHDYVDYAFDKSGRVRRVEKRSGEIINLTYDANNNIHSIESNSGKKTIIDYHKTFKIPEHIHLVGVGKVKFIIDNSGEITDVVGKDITITSQILEQFQEYESIVNSLKE